MIEIKGLSYKYPKGKFEIKDINLKIEKGYITALVGANGCGKTTLMESIYRYCINCSGDVFWDDVKITEKNIVDYHYSVAYVGADAAFTRLFLRDNTTILSALYPKFDKKYYDELIKMLDMEKHEFSRFYNISKGEKMKYSICFALATLPDYIIMDEPFANLDPVVKIDILEIIQRHMEKYGSGFFISTHLINEIEDVVDYVVTMKDGCIASVNEAC